MSQMKVTPEYMITIAGDMDRKISEWQYAIQRIYMLNEEMDAMWDGSANDSFNQVFAEERVKFQRLTEIMQEYSGMVRTAANNYIQGEEEIRQIVSKRG